MGTPRLARLDGKTKYRLSPAGGAEIWAKHKSTGEWRQVGTCHTSTTECIKNGLLTLRQCADQGLIRWAMLGH